MDLKQGMAMRCQCEKVATGRTDETSWLDMVPREGTSLG